mgnify:CR=1 FL=1
MKNIGVAETRAERIRGVFQASFGTEGEKMWILWGSHEKYWETGPPPHWKNYWGAWPPWFLHLCLSKQKSTRGNQGP